MALSADEAVALPKVLLHDHLDGGLRPSTLIELADEIGWRLPVHDADELQRFFLERGNELFQEVHMLRVTDYADLKPTKANILNESVLKFLALCKQI